MDFLKLSNQLIKCYFTGALLIFCIHLPAQSPSVKNVHFEQRTDGSLLVDVYYDVSSSGGLPLRISMEASNDDGITWNLPCSSLSGDVGEYISAGINKHIVWDFYADNPDTSGNAFRVKITADCMICGQTLTDNLTLTEDLICPDSVSPYLYIGAPNITLDLGGYKILGGGMEKGNIECIIAENQDSLSFINGGIENFNNGIVLYNSDHTIFRDLTFKNLEINDPLIFIAGIIVGSSKGVFIRDCQFEFLPVAHKQGVSMGNSEVEFINIEQTAGGTCLDFSGDKPSRGSVMNSRFTDITISAILIQHCDSLLIRNNTFTGNEDGIYTDPFFYGATKGLIIEENHFENNNYGILFNGNLDSRVLNNIIINNNLGIWLNPKAECVGGNPPPDIECFYSGGNLISGNTVKGNYLDLYHCDSCTGNTWINNECETSQGEEIPECNPLAATAGEQFAKVDSAAREADSDAELLLLYTPYADSTGRSYQWYYIYESASQGDQFEFWYRNGELIQQDSVTIPWQIEDLETYVTQPWIDSDSAVSIANTMGGRDFIESTEFRQVEMKLIQDQAAYIRWDMTYLAKDSMMVISVDAFKQ